MEIYTKKIVRIHPAQNNGLILSVDNGPGFSVDQYVFTEWVKLFEFLNSFYTNEGDNEKKGKVDVNPWAVDGPIYGGGS